MRDVARIAAADLKKDCYGALRLKQFCRFDHNNQSLTQFKKRIHSNKKTSLVANEGDGSEGASAVTAFVCFVAPVWDVVMVDVEARWQQQQCGRGDGIAERG